MYSFKLEQFENSRCDTCDIFWQDQDCIQPIKQIYENLTRKNHHANCPYETKSPYNKKLPPKIWLRNHQNYSICRNPINRSYETYTCKCGNNYETNISINLANLLTKYAAKKKLKNWIFNSKINTLMKQAIDKNILYKNDTHLIMPLNFLVQVLHGRHKKKVVHYRVFKYLLKIIPNKSDKKPHTCNYCQVAIEFSQKK